MKGADVDDYNRRAIERLMAKVAPDEAGHWIWQASIRQQTNPDKYGKFWYLGRPRDAHRVAYELFTGPIPDGFEVDHVCRITLCVNPAHLEAVPPEVNNARRELPKWREPVDEEDARRLLKGRYESKLHRKRHPGKHKPKSPDVGAVA